MPYDDTRINYRERKAERAAGYVMTLIGAHLTREDYKRFTRVLYDAFVTHGVEMISDYTRQELQMPPRGPDGWTREEIILYEGRLKGLLLEPPFLVLKTEGSDDNAG